MDENWPYYITEIIQIKSTDHIPFIKCELGYQPINQRIKQSISLSMEGFYFIGTPVHCNSSATKYTSPAVNLFFLMSTKFSLCCCCCIKLSYIEAHLNTCRDKII